jgi:hypothetical protein
MRFGRLCPDEALNMLARIVTELLEKKEEIQNNHEAETRANCLGGACGC